MLPSARNSPRAARAEENAVVEFFAEPRNWVVLAFVVFFALFGKKLWEVVRGLLDSRAAMVRAELDEAARLRKEAEAMLADAKQRREAAVADAKRLLEGAKAEAERLTEAAAADAEASAKRREQMALDRIAAAEKAAVDDVRLAAADIATAASVRVLRDGLTPAADAALIDHAISGLPAALAGRRAA
jgi:F-type H+-transporting ATPase subunit b